MLLFVSLHVCVQDNVTVSAVELTVPGIGWDRIGWGRVGCHSTQGGVKREERKREEKEGREGGGLDRSIVTGNVHDE